jgi:hypothetical protein
MKRHRALWGCHGSHRPSADSSLLANMSYRIQPAWEVQTAARPPLPARQPVPPRHRCFSRLGSPHPRGLPAIPGPPPLSPAPVGSIPIWWLFLAPPCGPGPGDPPQSNAPKTTENNHLQQKCPQPQNSPIHAAMHTSHGASYVDSEEYQVRTKPCYCMRAVLYDQHF